MHLHQLRPRLGQLRKVGSYTRHLKPSIPSLPIALKYSSMAGALPPQQFKLDRKIWNPSLYTSVHDFWFQGLEQDAKVQNATTRRRWWGLGRTEEEFKEIDRQVHQLFGPAVHSIGPSKLQLPEFQGYKHELDHAQEIAAPFLPEIGQGKEGADTLLAMILLLDQMPRHMFRTPPDLALVYRHYDRLAWSLFRSFKKSSTTEISPENPLGSPWYHARLVRKHWFKMPLIHSEDMASQDESLAEVVAWQNEAKEKGDEEVVEDLQYGVDASKSHRDIVERFGRFPHRNLCLERENTGEEEEWLKTGETFGVKQGGK
ncbi:hypothetical protein CB0940_07046 [Cercospora beticola]|uniref:DUF924-domain-containing protein n=1 Tax=Cercospora beticola TaxID=122368 RepID=A0A2G5H9I1_CERBT|nr:hypothetical protein CB0940_07046 [Cercospora beticola]PIA89196.1 hypothetical protein CB0940_07046 [Cercospora beticola]WPB02970.1 hypothetical protein RHO25_007606 [Cercospora beticola]CAK1358330.1 unnamed protein product [Cercospora beticola]